MSPHPSDEALQQLRLRYQAAIDVAVRYVDAGFDVVIDDVIIGPELSGFLELLPWPEIHLVVLDPASTQIAERDAERSKTAYGDVWAVETLRRTLDHDTLRLGHWIDSTGLTAAQTVELITADPEASRLRFPPQH